MHAVEWAPADRPEAAAALEAGGLPAWLAGVLARREVETIDQAKAFLNPAVDQLVDAARLGGMEEALERLDAARQAGERVAIVGDYDVDGVSATAILVAVLGACGLETRPILPHRTRDGYGFQPSHVERAVAEGCSLVITADCGSSSHEAARAAAEAGLGLIVTDHHLAAEALPAGVVEINPQRASCEYPFPYLCGAGLAFKLASAFAERCRRPVDPLALLRVACLGTICDMVPLRGENRVIASLGLAALPDSPSRGLRALSRKAGVEAPISASDVGFRLGPRLNAAGRMDDAHPALDLLLTRDQGEAERLAELLDGQNRTRREAENRVVVEARALFSEVETLPPILVAWSEGWHRGVVGIAAGRLAREFHRPTLLLTVDGESAVGSGRSIPGVHLHRFLSGWRGELDRFGGHAQAVGLSLPVERAEELREAWCAAAADWPSDLFVRRIEYELDLAAGQVTHRLLATLRRLEPFGQGNRQPLVKVGPLTLDRNPRLFGRNHLAARAVGPQGEPVELLGWEWAERGHELAGRFEVVGAIEHDRYRDGPVVRLVAARPADGADGDGTAERTAQATSDVAGA